MAACEAVFQTVELLEQIILNLRWYLIITVQGVNKHWRNVIRTSHSIKEVLFLQDSTTDRISWKVKPYMKEDSSFARTDRPNIWLPLPQSGALINPAAKIFIHMHRYMRPGAAIIEALAPIIQHSDPDVIGVSNIFHRPDASWRTMAFSSPPCVRLEFVCRRDHVGAKNFMPGVDGNVIRVENAKGITVGDMAYALCAHWHACEQCPVGDAAGYQTVVFPEFGSTGVEIHEQLQRQKIMRSEQSV